MSRDEIPTPKRKGRPPEFKEEYINLIRALRSEGYSISAFCSYVGISRDSYYRWEKEIPRFGEACKIAKEDSTASLENLGMRGARGEIKGFNVAAWKEIMDRQHGSIRAEENAQNNKTEINIGNMNVLQNMSQEEFQAKLQQKLIAQGILPPPKAIDVNSDPEEGSA